MTETIRLTTAQALVRWMTAQRSELLDGTVVPLFAGVFGIFGHGNVLGLGTGAVRRPRRAADVARPERAGHGAGRGRLRARRWTGARSWSPPRRSGPGALNMVTAAGLAHANRLPLLLLPGDTFAGRAPDPVLQQVEHFGDPTTSVNDAFRPVSRYFDRITRPEQLLASLPQVARVLTDPADCGPVILALPQDVQAEEFDFPVAMFAERLHRVPRPRPDVTEIAEAAALVDGADRPLLVLGGGVRYSGAGREALAFAEKHNVPVVETVAGRTLVPHDHPLFGGALGIVGSASANTLATRGRRGHRRRHPVAGLHDLLVDRLRTRCPARDRERGPLRRRQAQRPGGHRRRARGPRRALRRAGRHPVPRPVGGHRAGGQGRVGPLRRRPAGGHRAGRCADVRAS